MTLNVTEQVCLGETLVRHGTRCIAEGSKPAGLRRWIVTDLRRFSGGLCYRLLASCGELHGHGMLPALLIASEVQIVRKTNTPGLFICRAGPKMIYRRTVPPRVNTVWRKACASVRACCSSLRASANSGLTVWKCAASVSI